MPAAYLSNLKIKVSLLDANGTSVMSSVFDVTLSTSEISFENIKKPKLWDTQNPNLYTLLLELLDASLVKDKISDKVGLRWFLIIGIFEYHIGTF